MESKDQVQISGQLFVDVLEMATRQSKVIAKNAKLTEEFRQKLLAIDAWVNQAPPPKNRKLPTDHEERIERIRGILGLEVRC